MAGFYRRSRGFGAKIMNGPALDRYLDQASRGLWGHKRQSLREELHAHIFERSRHWQLCGYSAEQALEQVLHELGSPQDLNSAMQGVHLMPIIWRSVAVATVLASAVFLAWPQQSLAQVEVMTKGINPQVTSKILKNIEVRLNEKNLKWVNINIYVENDKGAWLSLPSLASNLRQLGLKVTGQGTGKNIPLKVTLPEGQSLSFQPSLRERGINYISDIKLLNVLQSTSLPISITGWQQPRLSIGQTSLSLGKSNNSPAIPSLYTWVIGDFMQKQLGAKGADTGASYLVGGGQPRPTIFRHSITVPPSDTPYLIVTRSKTGNPYYELLPVFDGQLMTGLRQEKLTFTSDPKQLTPYLKNGRNSAVLVKLTGRLDNAAIEAGETYEIVLPENPESDGVKQ
jgi:hypothetical protein